MRVRNYNKLLIGPLLCWIALELVRAPVTLAQGEPIDTDSGDGPAFIRGVLSSVLTCSGSVLNRTVQFTPGLPFRVPNVPVPQGAFRVRVVCETEEGTIRGHSEFLLGVPNGITDMGELRFVEEEAPVPVSLEITSPAIVLTPAASGAQLVTTGTLADGLQIDLTLSDTGTFYLSSNPAIATVSADGFVNAVSSGNVLITATHKENAGGEHERRGVDRFPL